MPMEWESTTAQGLHITQLSARYDAACKRVLSEKSILAWIMKSCLEEYQDCDIRDIAEKYREPSPMISVSGPSSPALGSASASSSMWRHKLITTPVIPSSHEVYIIVAG